MEIDCLSSGSSVFARYLLIAQNGASVYLIFPDPDAAYQDYLERGVGDAYLKMQTYGPFRLGVGEEVALLCRILLTVMLVAIKATQEQGL